MASPSPLVFTVRRHKPRLVVPAKSTQRELKQLSDIDDQEGLRFHVPVIMFYKSNRSMEGKDPVKVIREALAKALVFYYPFAGRLIEGPNRKLIVDCTGEGVSFIEADADVKLEQLGDTIQPGCPYLEELLHDVPGSEGILGYPLVLIQVTRFSCGGFTFAVRLNHTMSDGSGLVQFLNAIAEFAQGVETAPSVPPVWERELLTARKPPSITCHHHEYEEALDTAKDNANKDTIHRSFFFGPKEIRAIRNHLPPHHRTSCTTFDILTACLWKCRTFALGLHPNETARVSCAVNGRGKQGLKVPRGYYGNAFVIPAAVSKAGMLSTHPLGYAVELVKKAKAQVSEEYLMSVADLMVTKGRPLYTTACNYIVSDTRHLGFDKVDFGWGKPLNGGLARAISLISFYTSFRDSRGEDGIVVPICLPQPVMEKFEHELKKMIKEPVEDRYDPTPIELYPSSKRPIQS